MYKPNRNANCRRRKWNKIVKSQFCKMSIVTALFATRNSERCGEQEAIPEVNLLHVLTSVMTGCADMSVQQHVITLCTKHTHTPCITISVRDLCAVINRKATKRRVLLKRPGMCGCQSPP